MGSCKSSRLTLITSEKLRRGNYSIQNYGRVRYCGEAGRQDGAITTQGLSGEDVDLRFNVVPTKNGERIVMRILAGIQRYPLISSGFRGVIIGILPTRSMPQGMVR